MRYPGCQVGGCLIEARVAAENCEGVGAIERGALAGCLVGGTVSCGGELVVDFGSDVSKRFAEESAGWIGAALSARSWTINAGV